MQLNYLIDLYGEDAISNLMLFPETVLDVTGKNWNELELEWATHIKTSSEVWKFPNGFPLRKGLSAIRKAMKSQKEFW